MSSGQLALVLLAGLGAAALAIAGFALLRPNGRVPRNVVLVLIDTLRADHLGAYGYARPTSPFLDELAAKGLLLAVRALFESHGTSPAADFTLDEDAERALRALGYID